MSKVISESSFFAKGVNNQKRPNITITIKRDDMKDITKLTGDQKTDAVRWLDTQKEKIEQLINQIRKTY